MASAPDIHERTVTVPGALLSVLHLQRPGARGVVFFLHGNAGNLQGWFANADFYRAAGYDLVMPDYRGFGKSTGRITSAHELREDVRAVWSQVAPQYRGRIGSAHARPPLFGGGCYGPLWLRLPKTSVRFSSPTAPASRCDRAAPR